jgi:hypothetical protein
MFNQAVKNSSGCAQMSFDFNQAKDPVPGIDTTVLGSPHLPKHSLLYWSIQFTKDGINFSLNGESLASLKAATEGIKAGGILA